MARTVVGVLVWVVFCFQLSLLSFIEPHEYDVVSNGCTNCEVLTIMQSRKLKERSYIVANEKQTKGIGGMNLEDYRPIDPAPSSGASIRTGPIEHGSPVNPYIPKPPPPRQP
ncbi:hypothetical protein Scep_007502 [Stephania cephalantha]|uniref:Uncharacterized protein n=1 Tax=Stephania cephalantha TaxID=152367 RepID=A0AAP0KBB0_9MAGN